MTSPKGGAERRADLTVTARNPDGEMGRMTSDETVRWGIVATGNIATRFVQDLALLPDATALAVASRRLDSAREFTDEHGIDRAYGDWTELADDPDVEIVYVATPNQAHY